MSKFYPKRKSTDEIRELSIEDGSFIVNHETGEMYIDYEEKRILVGKGAPGYTPVKGKDYYTQEEKEEFIEDINSSIDIVTSKNDVSGETITIEDALESRLLDLKIEGKSEQETRSGKNLLNIDGLRTSEGLTNETSDTIINISGTSTNNYSSLTKTITQNIPIGTYTFSIKEAISVDIALALIYSDETQDDIIINVGNTSKTFTTTKEIINYRLYIRTKSGTIYNFKVYPMLESGSVSTEYEPYGVMPSPDYPSEIKSVGYTNLFDKDNAPIIDAFTQGSSGTIVTSGTSKLSYIECKPNTTYIAQKISGNKFCLSYSNQKPAIGTSFSGRVIDNTGTIITITTDNNAKYLIIEYYDRDNDEQAILNSIQIKESSIAHNYIPYNKYGIDVNVTGKNLYNYKDTNTVTDGIIVDEDGWITISFDNTEGTSDKYLNYYTNSLNLKSSTKYNIITEVKNVSGSGTLFSTSAYAGQSQMLNSIEKSFENLKGISIFNGIISTVKNPSNAIRGLRTLVRFSAGESGSITFRISVLEDTSITSVNFKYEHYKSNKTQLILNEPPRSLPNEVKDETYIENGKLYIKRKVGRVVLDGSEDWNKSSNTSSDRFYLDNSSFNMVTRSGGYSNYFINSTTVVADIGKYYTNVNQIVINFSTYNTTTLQQFKTWLSQNNVEVIYELAEPTIEEIGIVSPYTYDGVNHISVDGGFPTVFDIKYAQDVKVLLSDYYTKEEVDKLIADVKSLLETNTTNEEST
ncbi:MAG: hypothetical protein IJO32_00670 [Bacilli bacterium]|nr:hypothetical protein [Bacilli bacterium]